MVRPAWDAGERGSEQCPPAAPGGVAAGEPRRSGLAFIGHLRRQRNARLRDLGTMFVFIQNSHGFRHELGTPEEKSSLILLSGNGILLYLNNGRIFSLYLLE